MSLHLSQDRDADALLSSNPFALLVGMVLDQQVPLEWAFASPLELQRRLGRDLDAGEVAAMDPEQLSASFSAKPALHRYPGSMATRVHELARRITDDYDGRAEGLWQGVTSGTELYTRVRALPGFGEQKAKIFVALLGKQLGVRPEGWEAASAPYSDRESRRSVADITGPETLQEVRLFKQGLKAAHKARAAEAGERPAARAPARPGAPRPPKASTTKEPAAAPAARAKKAAARR
ncbi:MAG TPA: HhH-GPD-type base excision DNA repair protein [Acidimicrobiales bacterium]|nr:HhH-GPD-type base excision DNA repair protein [Acidimicrobiales bacterium]